MEMVMKFPNGETPNLLIEVFNYNPVCALQICYTSGLGRHRHGYEFVTDMCVWKHGLQEMFLLSCVEIILHPRSPALVGATQGRWQWNRYWWSGDRREGGTQVIKRLYSDCFFSASRLLWSTCQRALQPDIDLQIASNNMSRVFDWVWMVTAPEEQEVQTVCGWVWAGQCRLQNTWTKCLERCWFQDV